ncbi:4-alpha-glucanotransferase [Candidatus Methylospira mobilis]|uniref:4-alpha-glucanotransferase n=1 Tax=Candidatus Methylospira mobilis TaxID=1808979 RepID=A0A5Q0BE44_9GAMM|nr:4-alpha-glucanotransferase [Candidatus Methylospira mobilis]QFY41799.1 4-alpha-glucanotransferase [Candidatus Methylospira mobilis]WNV06663.1 4-alpha-glucanotransferase [Candidatus Methylospira mobilis]
MTKLSGLLARRRAGVLLHITSLPGTQACGDLGADARAFVDFLAKCGASVWQTLPVTPTHLDGSPYQSMSAHAGETRLISLQELAAAGWLPESALLNKKGSLSEWHKSSLQQAYKGFLKRGDTAEYESFILANAYWLPDYALYVALREAHGEQAWIHWPQPLRDRDESALAAARARYARAIDRVCFEQFVFFLQWERLRKYANGKGVALLGDMPIFVALDSADVWVERHYFDLDAEGHPNHIAGVPPDYFSITGQRWGNPLYRWECMEADNFRWWLDRMKTLQRLFDGIRIDHFRGFEAYWEIPSDQPTAVVGRWVKAPGHALLERFFDVFPENQLSLIAENLGFITPEVEALRTEFNLPGMAILQFGFDGSPDNPAYPENHVENCVVYSGTHDNDTTLSWFTMLSEEQQCRVLDACGYPDLAMPRALMACAMASRAQLAIVPMQDILELGVGYRMNTPGTSTPENWSWRFQWRQLRDEQAEWLQQAIASGVRAG